MGLTNELAYRGRTQSSRLTSGLLPPSYGALPPNNGTSSNGSSRGPPPYSPRSVVAGPAPVRPPGIPHPVDGPFQEKTSIVISRGLAICLAIVVLETLLIVCRSDALAALIDLKSAARDALRERVALAAEREMSERQTVILEQQEEKLEKEKVQWKGERVQWEQERVEWEREREESKQEREKSEREREKSEWEREEMRRDRELWEKAREDRVPLGAFWEVVWPAWDCRAYGRREYWGLLQNIPEGWSAMDACLNMPVEIRGVTIRRPYRCGFVGGSIHGYWMVDWDQPDCKPWYRDFYDAVSPGILDFPSSACCGNAHVSQGCTNHGSGARRIEAELVGINNKGGQDWWVLCSSTPLVWEGVTYNSPTHCEEQVGGFPSESVTSEADLCPR